MLTRAALRPRKQNAPRPAWKCADAFRQWLRGRECACSGRNPKCGGRMEAAHVDHAGGKGMGTKVADMHCVPLSAQCHGIQHAIGWKSFERLYLARKSAVDLAAAYWRAWPGRAAWEADRG